MNFVISIFQSFTYFKGASKTPLASKTEYSNDKTLHYILSKWIRTHHSCDCHKKCYKFCKYQHHPAAYTSQKVLIRRRTEQELMWALMSPLFCQLLPSGQKQPLSLLYVQALVLKQILQRMGCFCTEDRTELPYLPLQWFYIGAFWF